MLSDKILKIVSSVFQFVYILAKGNPLKKYLMAEDFVPLIQEIVDTHPGLGFLKEATEFHSRYVHTVSHYFTTVFKLYTCFCFSRSSFREMSVLFYFCFEFQWTLKYYRFIGEKQINLFKIKHSIYYIQGKELNRQSLVF